MSRPEFTSSRRFLSRVAAMLAFVAQLALVIAGLGEGTVGLGSKTHIDPGGTSTHYVHDEAVCAACQARSLHGVVRQHQQPTDAAPPRQLAAVTRPESFHDSPVPLQNLSRAPPIRTVSVS